MKSQGLSLSFIVIAVMAVLVLVVLAIFFTGGFKHQPIDRQKALNECNSRCLLEVQWASTGGTFPRANSKFCSYKADVKGLGNNLTCPDIVNCHINDYDCDISCSGSTANCSTAATPSPTPQCHCEGAKIGHCSISKEECWYDSNCTANNDKCENAEEGHCVGSCQGPPHKVCHYDSQCPTSG